MRQHTWRYYFSEYPLIAVDLDALSPRTPQDSNQTRTGMMWSHRMPAGFAAAITSYPVGSMYAIYGSIYHQYTPVMLAYIPYMDPMGIWTPFWDHALQWSMITWPEHGFSLKTHGKTHQVLEEVYRNPKGIHVALPWIVTRYSVFFFRSPGNMKCSTHQMCVVYYITCIKQHLAKH